jgi:hypothetical protein
MADAKIEVKVGEVSFTGEGSEDWLAIQLDKVIKHLPDLVKAVPAPTPVPSPHSGGAQPKANIGTLASFLAAKNAKSNKTRKFLATALWLQDGGKNRLATGDVTKALDDNNQGKVGNAAQCLINNAKQGFCAKDGKQFYVTDEGRSEIG